MNPSSQTRGATAAVVTGKRRARNAAYFLRRSQSLASMLPALLSGLIALVVAAVECLLRMGVTGGFFGAWMEAWLTAGRSRFRSPIWRGRGWSGWPCALQPRREGCRSRCAPLPRTTLS
jgi:hypothetical protein